MFSFHKPKIYRSNNGCCICRAKSSSSRFTDSKRYECEFENCFRIKERRSGEICNACVLLVKRWKKLPTGTNRHWHHVVDARAGPGIKSTTKLKSKQQLSPTTGKYKSPLKTRKSLYSTPSSSPTSFFDDTSINEDSCDKDMFSDSEESEDDEPVPALQKPTKQKRKSTDPRISPFLDLTYWKKTQVCCGIIFKGMNGEVLVDPQLLQPCWSCTKGSKSRPGELRRSQSTDDTESTTSSNSYCDMDSISENSPPDLTLAAFPCSETSGVNPYSQPPPLALEC